MQQGAGKQDGSGSRTGIWTTVASWLFAITLLVISAALVTWAIHGGIRMASAIEAEVEEDSARSEALAIPVQRRAQDDGGVIAEPGPAPPPPDGPPAWLQRPEPHYPREAIRARIERGEVELSCVARADGRVAFCTITSEAPEGYGFGRESVRAAHDARMRPARDGGEPVDARIQFPVHFRLQ
jgi:TonB family protein